MAIVDSSIISASLEKVATCSLSNVGFSLFTQTFFNSQIAFYVDANDPLPKNKYNISSNRVWSKYGDDRNNNQTDLKIKFDINRSFFVQVTVEVVESDTISFINADATDM